TSSDTLSLHDALPISRDLHVGLRALDAREEKNQEHSMSTPRHHVHADAAAVATAAARAVATHLAESIAASGQASLSLTGGSVGVDRKSTRLNSSHVSI